MTADVSVNIAAGDIVWEEYAPGVPLKVAKLWGDRAKGGEYAMLLKMPAGFEAGRHTHTADYHGVAVQGTWVHTNEGDTAPAKDLAPGSYVMQPGKQIHNDVCKGTTECILFIHQHAKGDFIPAKPPEARRQEVSDSWRRWGNPGADLDGHRPIFLTRLPRHAGC